MARSEMAAVGHTFCLLLFRAKQNFIKHAKNACIFKLVFEILFGGYAAPTKCEAFWKWALNSNFAGNAGFFLIAKFAKLVYISGICANTWKRT